ncbi:YheC/YheD family protein [Oceanobacillus oncorhynchi]|uniref:YheC/YheD family protein n=1 Tax=Oceanobacillus oncorhynchi TaxID=545501 RepID=UPI001865AF92|nr:YheC/YheD family protein [Oceanobacillus oncorhynchi]
MLAGYMDSYNSPTTLVNIIALVAKAKGINIIYFNEDGVDINKNKISGSIFIENKWMKVETKLPEFIDINGLTPDNEPVINHLAKHAYLTGDGNHLFSNKDFLIELAKDDDIKKYIAPSDNCSSFDIINEYLSLYNEIIITPVENQVEQGIFKITKKVTKKNLFGHKTTYIVYYNSSQDEMSLEELKSFYNNNIKGSKHTIQQNLLSTTNNGDPFDCKIHLEKNGEGEWQIAKNFIRIGLGSNAISNVKQGAGIADAKVFFKANYPEHAKTMLEKLNMLGLQLASKIEDLSNLRLANLGLEIVIDSKGNLYLSKIDSNFIPNLLFSDISLLRTDYYNFIRNNLIKQKID